MAKKNTFLRVILWIVGILVVLCAALALIWRGEIRSMLSVNVAEDNEYLYVMQYSAPYDLDDLIEKDVDTNADLLSYVISRVGKGIPLNITSSQVAPEDGQGEDPGEHCTVFQSKNAIEDGYVFGRNYDFYKNPSLVTYSYPKDGYASVAVSDMSHMGYGLDHLPVSLLSKVNCLAAIYAPLDGINEKGLCTAILALPKMPAYQDEPSRHSVGTTVLMRLFLDRCATVDEAIELTRKYNIRHDQKAGGGYHYMVADAAGNCAVIEFDPQDGWKTMVVAKDTAKNHMLVTNHLLSPKYFSPVPDPRVGNINSHSWWRYAVVDSVLTANKGMLTVTAAAQTLSAVHWKDLVWEDGTVEDTQYSAVYDQRNLSLTLRSWKNYEDKEYFFVL